MPIGVKKCPDCKNWIDKHWVRCWYCGFVFEEMPKKTLTAKQRKRLSWGRVHDIDTTKDK